MKESSLLRRKKPNCAKKIKLICSYNGTFQKIPPSTKLRYIGGETRIVSVDRNIGFFRLRSKISDLCPEKTFFTLKYQLPDSASISEDFPLVSIASDEDVRCMIEEFDKLEANGRLRIFVCGDRRYVLRCSLNL